VPTEPDERKKTPTFTRKELEIEPCVRDGLEVKSKCVANLELS
jgi:hypothetical protein